MDGVSGVVCERTLTPQTFEINVMRHSPMITPDISFRLRFELSEKSFEILAAAAVSVAMLMHWASLSAAHGISKVSMYQYRHWYLPVRHSDSKTKSRVDKCMWIVHQRAGERPH